MFRLPTLSWFSVQQQCCGTARKGQSLLGYGHSTRHREQRRWPTKCSISMRIILGENQPHHQGWEVSNGFGRNLCNSIDLGIQFFLAWSKWTRTWLRVFPILSCWWAAQNGNAALDQECISTAEVEHKAWFTWRSVSLLNKPSNSLSTWTMSSSYKIAGQAPLSDNFIWLRSTFSR